MSDTQTNSTLYLIQLELKAIRRAIEAYVNAQGVEIPPEPPRQKKPTVTKTMQQYAEEAKR